MTKAAKCYNEKSREDRSRQENMNNWDVWTVENRQEVIQPGLTFLFCCTTLLLHYKGGVVAVYIRADKRKYKTYYWLVESHREGKKVIQRRIRSLGTERPTGKRLNELKKVVEDLEKI